MSRTCPLAIHFSGQTVFSLTHIEGITLGAGEEVDEVAGGAGGMSVDGICEVGDRTSERQAAGVYGAGFTAGCPPGPTPGSFPCQRHKDDFGNFLPSSPTPMKGYVRFFKPLPPILR